MSVKFVDQTEEFEELVADARTMYLREIGDHELLTAEEEIALGQQLEAGKTALRELAVADESLDPARRCELEQQADAGEQARRRLVECNLRLVLSVARRYRGRGLSYLDLVQEGNIGLQTGVEHYDWRRGFRLSTYVYWWIRQAMLKALADQSRAIRLPISVIEVLQHSARAECELSAQLGRKPTLCELAEYAEIEPDRIIEARRASNGPLSLDVALGPDTETTRADLLCDDASGDAVLRSLESAELSERLEEALDELSACERAVLRMRFGLNGSREQTIAEISKETGISRERIRHIQSEGLRKLRSNPKLRRELLQFLA
jgi:RNA polymerase primary sigma factor